MNSRFGKQWPRQEIKDVIVSCFDSTFIGPSSQGAREIFLLPRQFVALKRFALAEKPRDILLPTVSNALGHCNESV